MNCYYCYAVPALLFLYAFRKYQEYKWRTCNNNVLLTGKVALITGANSGIGFEVAKELGKRGAKVIMACRDLAKADEAIKLIENDLKDTICPNLVPMQLDLGSLKSVKLFAEEINKTETKIDILINNAGVSLPKKEFKTTEDGFELHFGVNHLGHFLLTNLLLPKLKAAESSRVIVVSSSLHKKGNIYLNDLNAKTRSGRSPEYNNSKLANVYFGQELARKLQDTKVKVYSVCPGWVYTGLFRHYNIQWYHYIMVSPIALLFLRSASQGAQTIIYCATDPDLGEESGLLYRNCGLFKSNVIFDPEIGKKLWEASENMINADAKIL